MMNTSSNLFEEYLRSYNFQYERSDNNDKIFPGKKKPDFLIYTQHNDIICEIKEFDFEIPCGEPYSPIKEKINSARIQFKEYKKANIPCVLILSNPLNSPVSLSEDWILGAMYGNINMSFSIDLPAKMRDLYFGKDGKLRGQNTTISAVAILERVIPRDNKILRKKASQESKFKGNTPKEIAMRVSEICRKHHNLGNRVLRMRTYHNIFAKNVLNKNIFCKKEDEQYEYDATSYTFILTQLEPRL